MAQGQTTKAVFPAGASVTIGPVGDTTHERMGWGSAAAFTKFYTTINQLFMDALKDTSISPEDITRTTDKLINELVATGEMTSFKCGTSARVVMSQALGHDDTVYVVKTDKGYWMVKAGSLVAAQAPSKEELLKTRQGLNGGFTHQVDGDDYYLMNQGTNIVIHTGPGRTADIEKCPGLGPNKCIVHSGYFKFLGNSRGTNGFGASVLVEEYEPFTVEECKIMDTPHSNENGSYHG